MNSASSLVNSPATPATPPQGKDTGEGAFIFPTTEQQAAINEFKDYNEDTVIAWLDLVRSLEPGFLHHGVGAVSSEQLNALTTLRNCRDSNIVVWLQCLALTGTVNISPSHSRTASKPSTASSLRQSRRPSNKSTPRSSVASLVPSLRSITTTHSTPRSSLGYAYSLPDLPEDDIEQHRHTHWCHECDKSVNTCDSWKRHMKEHETHWPCMPLGPVEETAGGLRCAFCGHGNPDHHHLAGHRASLCTSSTKGAAKKSRKSLMVDHLAFHGILDTAASDLADRWQCTRNRRAFGCGFCVKACSTLVEQLRHIDNEHYKHGQTKAEWDSNKVIMGLLHQPKVYKAWQKILASDVPFLEEKFRWESPAIEALQLRLESGNESGADLALSAYGSSIYDSQPVLDDRSPAITVPLLQRMATGLGPATFHQQAVYSHHSAGNSSPGQNKTLIGRPHDDTLSWDEACAFGSNTTVNRVKTGRFLSIPSDDSFEADCFGDRSSSLQAPFFDTDNYHTHNPPSPDPFDFLNSGLGSDHHAQLQGHINNDGALVALQLSYPQTDHVASFEDSDMVFTPFSSIPTSTQSIDEANLPSPNWNNGGPATQDYPNAREKPLPALPAPEERSSPQVIETRPMSPMDVDYG